MSYTRCDLIIENFYLDYHGCPSGSVVRDSSNKFMAVLDAEATTLVSENITNFLNSYSNGDLSWHYAYVELEMSVSVAAVASPMTVRVIDLRTAEGDVLSSVDDIDDIHTMLADFAPDCMLTSSYPRNNYKLRFTQGTDAEE